MNLWYGVQGVLLSIAFMAVSALAGEASGGHYTFSWPFAEEDELRPRGGTTRGPDVETVHETTAEFQRLREEGLSDFERDRRAILAMAGPYRVSFDFLEVVGYPADYEPRAPYQSWGTEYIYVVADQGERIVLQHLMVMSVIDDKGETLGPFVTKHWRQDWEYEAASIHAYRGENIWRETSASPQARRGHWAQSVWQVSDAPRYAAWGEWQHREEYSTWTSDSTWRPLPRREFSVRDDYDALVGVNQQTILPTGWVHEQRNEKVVVGGPGEIHERLALEYGLARYERIRGYDFSPGDDYLEATAPFWRLVRDRWEQLLARREVLPLKAQVDQEKLFEPLFARARAIADGEREFDPDAERRFVRRTIDRYIAEDAPAASDN